MITAQKKPKTPYVNVEVDIEDLRTAMDVMAFEYFERLEERRCFMKRNLAALNREIQNALARYTVNADGDVILKKDSAKDGPKTVLRLRRGDE